jgi:hypothetical protein
MGALREQAREVLAEQTEASRTEKKNKIALDYETRRTSIINLFETILNKIK